MAALQDRHWWYRGRRMLVDQLLSQHLSVAGTPARLLEIGAGTGSNLQVLSAHGSVTAVEPAPYAAACIESAHPDVAAVRQFWPDASSSVGQFDAILLLDVLEHIDDDRAALRAVVPHLAPGGIAIISVPAYQSLWSEHDELLWHKRRYSRRGLRELIRSAELDIVELSGFNWMLFGVAWIARRLTLRFATGDNLPPTFLNAALAFVLRLEVMGMRFGIRPAFGLSIVSVVRRNTP
jgi:SAM-dependent methyltransferase